MFKQKQRITQLEKKNWKKKKKEKERKTKKKKLPKKKMKKKKRLKIKQMKRKLKEKKQKTKKWKQNKTKTTKNGCQYGDLFAVLRVLPSSLMLNFQDHFRWMELNQDVWQSNIVDLG